VFAGISIEHCPYNTGSATIMAISQSTESPCQSLIMGLSGFRKSKSRGILLLRYAIHSSSPHCRVSNHTICLTHWGEDGAARSLHTIHERCPRGVSQLPPPRLKVEVLAKNRARGGYSHWSHVRQCGGELVDGGRSISHVAHRGCRLQTTMFMAQALLIDEGACGKQPP
jgi:hypothetical protein